MAKTNKKIWLHLIEVSLVSILNIFQWKKPP